ncbi:MAG: 16S rRNA (cytosine(1402)-N(4))-methyltransferase RsmH [Mariprofundales bacterium]|nr:16S rRNA (cytosine(1402)-N(4))-methyltransferase RsmH [Mariprofundales bacterium]
MTDSDAKDDGHVPVLATPFVEALCHRPDGVVVDATFGRGGHSRMVLERLSNQGRLIALDRDPEAVAYGQRLEREDARFRIVHAEFGDLGAVLAEMEVTAADAVGFDFGVSSPQLDQQQRGFSFGGTGPLDMRMNPEMGAPLSSLLAKVNHSELTKIIREYGEERFAGRVARTILEARDAGVLSSTTDLAEVITRALPAKARHPKRHHGQTGRDRHPATRTFQGLRIWVNDEYGQIARGLASAMAALTPGGKLVAIAFHSGEDSRVRDIVESHVHPCTCPPQFPICICHRVADMAWTQKKPLRADAVELAHNPRARSAKLRIATKCYAT